MMRFALVVSLLVGTSVSADTQIFRCALEDGTFAFQETPCVEPSPSSDDASEADEISSDSGTPTASDDISDFVNPFDEPASPPPQPEPALPEPVSQDRAECEKMTRDAIDAIDLEMRERTYTKDEGRAYLAALRALTQQLRACKQL